MIAIIQCAGSKVPRAGHMKTRDGRNVLFVARPADDPVASTHVHARPDDDSDWGGSWREELQRYNRRYTQQKDNPCGLLPASKLYKPRIYRDLVAELGEDRVFILSAGWGLVRASFLLPAYDITFSRNTKVPSHKRRRHAERREEWKDQNDLLSLPSPLEPIHFFGGRDYLPLFDELTRNVATPRTVHYFGETSPDLLGCTTKRFESTKSRNWHYDCAADFLQKVTKRETP
ncbi:MAG: hypothetical protein ACT4O6_25100 [Reyranella sp.]